MRTSSSPFFSIRCAHKLGAASAIPRVGSCYDERLGVHIKYVRMIVHKSGKYDGFEGISIVSIGNFRRKFHTILRQTNGEVVATPFEILGI